MEFTKDICFNDSLTNGKIATITYSGDLFRSGSEYVNLVFGFGENWDYTTTLPMQKTENGFTVNVEMRDYNIFNFCFSNEHNNWDNNNNSNYISPILPKVTEEDKSNANDIDYGADYSASIDDIIEDILGNTVQNSIANDKDEDSVDKILETINEETLPEIEELFSELFSEEFDHPEKIEEIKPEVAPSISEETNAELIRLFNELFDSASKTQYFEEEIVESTSEISQDSFDLDDLVSDLLEPVVAKTDTNIHEEISLFDDIKEDEEEETSLTVIDSNDLLVSSRKLGSFYRFKKKIKIACYKLFIKIPKELIKQLGFGEN